MSEEKKMLKLRTRYYRALPVTNPGYEEEIVELDPKKTAILGMHCWNIGCEDGPDIDPNYAVGMGFPETFHESEVIMKEKIAPAFDAARKAGILPCHVTIEWIGERDPLAQKYVNHLPVDDEIDSVVLPGKSAKKTKQIVPGWREYILNRAHGKDFLNKSPLARMARSKICQPLAGEPYVYQTGQLIKALQENGIENIIYTGFATDMCVLRAGGGVEDTADNGFRVFLMRDATLAGEFPDTIKDKSVTDYAVRFFEFHYGNSLTLEDFAKACENIK